jgi:hypothetical protein
MVRQSATVVGYVPRRVKKRMERLQAIDRRLTQSRMIEEALTCYLSRIEQEMLPGQAAPSDAETSH